ncbi:conjugal transfer protein TraO [Flagellimonas sp. S174]|uniref:conjugal transfer protein TraO n=1 Tax=Flagellimonas sp. S174 TaxID=3410790 RepID=UPI003BF4A60D
MQQSIAQRSNFSLGIAPNYKVNGYGISGNLNYYHNTTDYFQLSIVAAFSEEQPNSAVEFPFEDYLVNVGYFTTVLTSPRRGTSIFFGGGPSVGYEIINDNVVEVSFGVPIPESTFVYGVYASFEMNFYLTDSLSLIVPITGIYHHNSEVEEIKTLLGLGIRFYLN